MLAAVYAGAPSCSRPLARAAHGFDIGTRGLLESFVFRRALCGEQTRGYWQIFANLAYRIDIKKPLESLKVRLALMPESYTFPGDAEFRSALEGRDIYHMRVCFDLLDSLENRGTKEPTDTSKYSIEHLSPCRGDARKRELWAPSAFWSS
jgi:hypothetical protein